MDWGCGNREGMGDELEGEEGGDTVAGMYIN